jgi:hypothetical protein
MGGRGPAPKESHSRARDTARRRAPAVTVVPDAVLRGPELPDEYQWSDATRSWWQTWRESPQAQMFTATDWSYLLDTAVLHADFWLGDRTVESGLRLRVAKFGATPEDRQRLRLAVGEPTGLPEPRPSARQISSRNAPLLRAVDSDKAHATRPTSTGRGSGGQAAHRSC